MGPDEPGAGSIESLYPFLYAGTTDLPAVLEEVRRSTIAKAEEIIQLRREVAKLKAERDILKKAAAYFAKEPI